MTLSLVDRHSDREIAAFHVLQADFDETVKNVFATTCGLWIARSRDCRGLRGVQCPFGCCQ